MLINLFWPIVLNIHSSYSGSNYTYIISVLNSNKSKIIILQIILQINLYICIVDL